MQRHPEKMFEYQTEEGEKAKEEIPWTNCFVNSKRKIIESLTVWLEGEEQEEEREAERASSGKREEKPKETMAIMKKAADFYKSLTRLGPEKKREKEDFILEEKYPEKYFETLQALHSKISTKQEKETPEKRVINPKVDIREYPLDKEKKTLRQEAVYVFFQEGGGNLIQEAITNSLSEGANLSVSELKIRNPKTFKSFNLGDLLPQGFRFAPAEMVQAEYKVDETTGEIETIPVLVDLKSYPGTRNSEDAFETRVYGNLKMILYGNLTKKGGLLTLLHEISHSWQLSSLSKSAREKFESFYRQVGQKLAFLNIMRKETLEGKMQKEYFEEKIKEPCLKELRELGVEINEERFTQEEGQELKSGESVMKYDITSDVFLIKSEELDQLIKDYEKEERDAWAYGLKVLRFLKREDVDLEPQLKTLKDLEEIIEPCLSAYQKEIEEQIESSTKPIEFTRKRK